MNLHEEISKAATELYEKSGRVEGRDLDNWLEAEKIVTAQYRKQEKLEAKNLLLRKRPQQQRRAQRKLQQERKKTRE